MDGKKDNDSQDNPYIKGPTDPRWPSLRAQFVNTPGVALTAFCKTWNINYRMAKTEGWSGARKAAQAARRRPTTMTADEFRGLVRSDKVDLLNDEFLVQLFEMKDLLGPKEVPMLAIRLHAESKERAVEAGKNAGEARVTRLKAKVNAMVAKATSGLCPACRSLFKAVLEATAE